MPLTVDVERESVTPRSTSPSAVSSHSAPKKRLVEPETASDARPEITLTRSEVVRTHIASSAAAPVHSATP